MPFPDSVDDALVTDGRHIRSTRDYIIEGVNNAIVDFRGDVRKDGATLLNELEVVDAIEAETPGIVSSFYVEQEFPPVGAALRIGTEWYIPSLKHRAKYNGTSWTPITPESSTLNLCCILGAATFLSKLPSLDNAGLSGSANNLTLTNATATTDGNGKAMITHDGVDDHTQAGGVFQYTNTQEFTLVVIKRQAAYASGTAIAGNRAQLTNVTSTGFGLYTTGTAGAHVARVCDGVSLSEIALGNASTTETHLVALVVDRDLAKMVIWLNDNYAIDDGALPAGNINSASALRVARLAGSGTQYTALNLYAMAVFPWALTDEMVVLNTWRQNRFM